MTVLGVDISKWSVYRSDGINISDGWNPDRATRPIDFVIQRSSYASLSPYVYEDEALDWLYEQCLKIPVRGFYHYFGSGTNYRKQMEVMLNAVEGKDYHFLVLDYEKGYNYLDNRTFAELIEMAKQMKEITKKNVMLYFNYDVYANYMKPFGAESIIGQYDCWYAAYPYVLDWNKPPIPPKNVNMRLWQGCGGDIPTSPRLGKEYGTHPYQTGIDVNRWMGTLEELYVWAGLSEPVDPPTDPPVEPPIVIDPPVKITLPQTVRVDNLGGLNSRDVPSVFTGKIVSHTSYNMTITILEIVNGLDGNVWGKTDKGWSCLLLKPSKYFTQIKGFDLYDVGEYTIPPQIELETLPKEVTVTNAGGLNARNIPTTVGSQVSKVNPKDSKITILEIVNGLDGNIWGKTVDGWVCLLWKSTSYYYTSIKNLDVFKVTDYVPSADVHLYYRLKHDTENYKWGYKSRVITLAEQGLGSIKVAYPQTMRYEGGRGNVELSPAWVGFLKSINTVRAVDYVSRYDFGWRNRGDWPKVEQLSFCGNIVEIERIEGNKAYLKNYYYNDEQPPTLTPGFYDASKIHYFSVVDRYGKVTATPVGQVRVFIIANDRSEKLWIPLDQLVRVDKLSVFVPS